MTEQEVERELQRQLEILEYGTVEITPREEFVAMLKKSIATGVPLRIKCGIDPTRVDIHLGHLVPYRKMRAFQDLGHVGVVVVGDYTARIGDPTGKIESRPPLSEDDVKSNAKFYMDQLLTVLDENKTEFRFQTEWFGEVGLADVLRWAGQVTVAKLLSHETFAARIESNQALGLHEFFYPVLQGVDSVYIEADVELGGTDQKFNVLMGRDFQKAKDMRPQVAMLLPIVTGTDGKMKMSKSLGNYIGVMDEPFDKFGKVMSIPDELMVHYYQYVANTPSADLAKIRIELESGALHPNECKKRLATQVVALFHGEEVAQNMRAQFEAVFAKKQTPDEIDEFTFERGSTLIHALSSAAVVSTNSEARRLIQQNAVTIVDGPKITDVNLVLDESYAGKVIKVGKRRFIKLL